MDSHSQLLSLVYTYLVLCCHVSIWEFGKVLNIGNVWVVESKIWRYKMNDFIAVKWCDRKKVNALKYGFCDKSFQKDEPLTSWTLFSTYLSSLLGVIAGYNSNHAQKCGQICCKSVQLVRGSSFRNDLLQNPYFKKKHETTVKKSKKPRKDPKKRYCWECKKQLNSCLSQHLSKMHGIFDREVELSVNQMKFLSVTLDPIPKIGSNQPKITDKLKV